MSRSSFSIVAVVVGETEPGMTHRSQGFVVVPVGTRLARSK
jgi:hypothetical protein